MNNKTRNSTETHFFDDFFSRNKGNMDLCNNYKVHFNHIEKYN